MTQTTIDQSSRAVEAFSGNRLLSTFSPADRALLESFGESIDLAAGALVLRSGEQVEASIFPLEGTMISMTVELSGGRSVEVASVGNEGAVGGIVSCGYAPAYSSAKVLVPGPAFRIPMKILEDAKGHSPFIANLFCRFSDYLLAEVMQSVACNAFHSIPERAARWLLQAQDRAGDRIELTQEAFAGLLGVQRTTINAVVQQLASERLIATGRGTVRVTDRGGLKRRACECYQHLRDHFDAVIGVGGRGTAS